MLRRIALFLRENLLSAIGFVLVTTSIANFLNYVFNVVAARFLGPSLYGEFAALLAILLIITVPANSLQALITKYVSEFHASDDMGSIRDLIIQFFKLCLYASLATMAIFLAFRGIIAGYLHIESDIPLIICGLTAALTLLTPIFGGILQGFQKFIWLGTFFLLYAVGRIVFGLLLIVLGYGVSGAIGGGAIGALLAAALAFAVVKDVFAYRPPAVRVKIREIARSYLPIIGAMLVFFAMVSLDQVIVKRKFSDTMAGEYACASFIGKMILYFPQAVAIVLYPKFVELYYGLEDTRNLLRKGSAITLGASVGLSVVFIGFPQRSISILYGSEYTAASSILWVFCLAMSGYALINLFIYYFLATSKAGFIFKALTVAFVFEVLAMYILADSLFQVAAVHLLVSLFLVAGSLIRVRIYMDSRG